RDAGELENWSARMAAQVAARDPLVQQIDASLIEARIAAEGMEQRHRAERRLLFEDLFGVANVRSNPLRYNFLHADREATNAEAAAQVAREEAATLQSLPPSEAVARIEAQQEAAKNERETREARAGKLNRGFKSHWHDRGSHHRE